MSLRRRFELLREPGAAEKAARRSKNGEKWDLIRPLLGDASLRPTKEREPAGPATREGVVLV